MRLSFLSCLLVLGLWACEGTPEYRLGFPAGDVGDLGDVRITERATQSIAVENTGRQAVTLETIALEQGWDGVLTIDVSATDCIQGLTLAVGERCSVGIAFEPANDITYRDSLHVAFRPEDGVDAFQATLFVSGVGVLDCSLRPEYVSSFATGSEDADAQIAVDVVEARAAGEALTEEDGYADGYASTYDGAYEQGFEPAYNDGRVQGYDDGYADGASALACREGELDGYADGSDAGLVDGEEDGLFEGDDAGYDDGYANGTVDGEADYCFVEKVDPDPSLPGKCVLQGYAANYSRGPYNTAYAEAVAANTTYLDGVSRGEREGRRVGQADGIADGYAEGYREGADFGFADGDADQYEACYAVAVDEGYEDAYLDAYDAFFDAAYDDAYSVGYDDGYQDGSFVCR